VASAAADTVVHQDVAVPADVARANVLDEDTGEWLTEEEVGSRTERLLYGTPEVIRAELDLLEEVLAKADKVTPHRDSKLQKLLDSTLPLLLAHHPKVIIFTRYVDTLTYLAEQIARDRQYQQTAVFTIHGSLNERQRADVFQGFTRATRGVLIATDAISEGINLQYAAAQVVHYELPWNPNRLEQRNGRVDRFGQPQPVVRIRTLVMDETLDATILKVLVEKAAQIRADYGFSPPYFGDETDILALIRDHEVTLGVKQLGLFDPLSSSTRGGGAGDAPNGDDPFAAETLQRIQSDSFYGQTHIALPDIERRLRETEDAIGSPVDIQHFVFSGLNRFGCGVEDNGDGTVKIVLQNPVLQTAALGTVIPRATFDAELGLDDPDVTVLDLGHPLMRRLIEVVKQRAFQGEDALHYGRTSYKVTSDVDEVTAIFTLLARYVAHTEPTSIIEELLPVALPVYSDQPSAFSLQQALAWLNAEATAETRLEDEVKEALRDALDIPDLNKLLMQGVEARRTVLVAERQAMRAQLEAQESAQATAWLRGIDDLAPGTFDLLTVTVLFPA
jgi:hypothetical protein